MSSTSKSHICTPRSSLTQVSRLPWRGRQVLSDNLITGNGENRVSLGEGSPLLLRKQLF